MKRFVQDVWKHLLLLRDLLLVGGAFMGGMYLVGIVISTVFMARIDSDESIVLVGGIMLLAALIYMCFFSAAQMVSNYNYAIAMGQTRRQTIPAYLTATFLVYLVFDLLAVVLHGIERWLMSVVCAGLPQEDVIEPLVRVKYLLLLALAGTAVTMLLGAAIMKFGKAAFVAFWLVIMAVCIGGGRVSDYLGGVGAGSALAHWVQQQMSYVGAHVQAVVLGGGTAVSVICILAAYLMLRRQQVTV